MVAQPDMPACLAAALAYAARGWRVFPLQPMSKKPFAGTRGLLDASTDEATIRRWWMRWPAANVAIACGNGLGIVDEDTYKGGDASPLHLPPTLTATTPRGGKHMVYAVPQEVRPEHTGKLGKCVDFQGDGAYVVAPPSRTADGVYAWLDEHQPVQDLPGRILEMLKPTAKRDDGALWKQKPTKQEASLGDYWVERAVERVRQGSTRNVTGHWLAQQLVWNDCRDPEGAMMAYAAEMRDSGDHTYEEREAMTTLREVQRQPKREPARSQSAKVTPIRPEQPAKPAQDIPKTIPRTDGANALKEPPPDMDALLLQGEADDNGNAEAMWRLFGRDFLYTPALGWLRWIGTHWASTPEEIVTQYAIKALKKRRHAAVEADKEKIIGTTKQDRSRVSACRDLFKSYVIEPDVSVFDADPDALNCKNGVLDLRTGKLTPHNSKQRLTYCLGVEWDESADETFWKTWLLDTLGGNEKTATYFQLCAGYSLTGHISEEKMFYLYGPTRAGKGTVTETLLHLLGKPLSEEVDFITFTAPRDNDSQNFDLAELKPARLVVASESKRTQPLNTSKIKQMTGGNMTRCAFKHRDMFSYRPQYKIWLVSNWEAKADPDDDATWGRVQVFEFPHSHLGAEDTTLKARMKAPDNLRGVLRWAVEGAKRWYELGKLVPPESVTKATQAQRDNQDYVRLWIDDCCTLDADAWSQSAPLMRSYTAWCDNNNVEARSVRNASDFADTLTKRIGCTPKRQAGTGRRGFNGITLRGVTCDT